MAERRWRGYGAKGARKSSHFLVARDSRSVGRRRALLSAATHARRPGSLQASNRDRHLRARRNARRSRAVCRPPSGGGGRETWKGREPARQRQGNRPSSRGANRSAATYRGHRLLPLIGAARVRESITPSTTTAPLDHLTHHREIVATSDESRRFRLPSERKGLREPLGYGEGSVAKKWCSDFPVRTRALAHQEAP